MSWRWIVPRETPDTDTQSHRTRLSQTELERAGSPALTWGSMGWRRGLTEATRPGPGPQTPRGPSCCLSFKFSSLAPRPGAEEVAKMSTGLPESARYLPAVHPPSGATVPWPWRAVAFPQFPVTDMGCGHRQQRGHTGPSLSATPHHRAEVCTISGCRRSQDPGAQEEGTKSRPHVPSPGQQPAPPGWVSTRQKLEVRPRAAKLHTTQTGWGLGATRDAARGHGTERDALLRTVRVPASVSQEASAMTARGWRQTHQLRSLQTQDCYSG